MNDEVNLKSTNSVKRKSLKVYFLILTTFFLGWSCSTREATSEPNLPNVILIMADDMGYECLSSNGCLEYQTPVLDQLAVDGIRFTGCIAQPLCTPSRVKIMTGLYNFRNYEHFTYLNSNQRTFGNFMKETGYQTCIAGKWQLNGIVYDLPGCRDNQRPRHFGFDEYCLWQLTKERKDGKRFANPLIEQNGVFLERDSNAYGPDIFADFILDYIDRKKEHPFFVYYPMVLVHSPFVPTPDSDAWSDPSSRYRSDTIYFKEMVEYLDKTVGRIVQKLKAENLFDNTLLIFTGDNGTHVNISTNTVDGPVRGFKGNTTDGGTRVPLVVSWPDKIKESKVYDGLIEFSDFYATLADVAGREEKSDGVSFYGLLTGEDFVGRETAFVHYDPRWNERVNQYRGQFARTVKFKLYNDGRFYDLAKDRLELQPIPDSLLTDEQLNQFRKLRAVLERAPKMTDEIVN